MKEYNLLTLIGWEHLLHAPHLLGYVVLAISCIVTFWVTRRYLNTFLVNVFARRHPTWKKILERNKTFRQLSYLVPVLFVYHYLQQTAPDEATIWQYINAYIFINLTLFIATFIRSIGDIYELSPLSRERPLKSYIQLITLVIYIMGSIFAVCALMDVSPTAFLTGAFAIMAAVTFVFKDTIMSFITSMQIAANNLLKKGDWIEVKQFGADGKIIDIALHVVRVQNFDNTIISIPTYKLLDAGFRNWQGMFDSGGRQIKRCLIIDQTSVKFLTPSEISKLANNRMVRKHLPNIDKISSPQITGSQTDITNLGLFRSYIVDYLKTHPEINHNMTTMVRHLEPTPEGLPLQIYAYTSDTVWVNHENIQADIFEHLIVMMNLFDIELYQQPKDNLYIQSNEKTIDLNRSRQSRTS